MTLKPGQHHLSAASQALIGHLVESRPLGSKECSGPQVQGHPTCSWVEEV
jgi:hypothetical protein